jgi:dUTP pyrophosphatase
MTVRVSISRVPGTGSDVPLPGYATPGSAGMDLRAVIADPVVIAPGGRALVACGFMIAIPPGYEGQVRARSGLAVKQGIGVLNGPGTIDSDYRGEVKVILGNFGHEPFTVNRGDRIAQLVIAPVARAEWEERKTLDDTGRGAGGFGHTGK